MRSLITDLISWRGVGRSLIVMLVTLVTVDWTTNTAVDWTTDTAETWTAKIEA